MQKMVLSALLLSLFLQAVPAYPQKRCVPVVSDCKIHPHLNSFQCTSSAGFGEEPGDACAGSNQSTYYTCTSSAFPDEVCCKCRVRSFLIQIGVTIVVLDPAEGTRIEVVVVSGAGLQSVDIESGKNARIEIPEFEIPTFLPVIVSVFKVDSLLPSSFMLRACDSNGCRSFDPVNTLVVRETGKPAQQRFTDLPFEENKVLVLNADPGVNHLELRVNGRRFQVVALKPGEQRELDIAAAMMQGEQNEVTLRALGKPGGSVTVVIHD